jgi:tetratricopeptide (TPR) repeat protein
MNRRDRRASARNPQAPPNAPGAGTPAALYSAGLRHLRAERYLDAQVCCRQALAIDSDHADTLHLMGLLSLQTKQYDHAVEWLARAIRLDPKPEYLSSLGTTLQQQGRHEEALKAFDKAVQLKPDDADLWINLGNVLVELERPADAVLSFQHVLKLDPRHGDAAYRSGFLLLRLGRPEQALAYFNLSDELQPNQAVILEMRAIALHGLKRFEQALADNRRAHALNPGNAETCNNIAASLQFLCRDQEALPWFDRALALRPDFIVAFLNKASTLQQLHRFDEAFAIYQHVKTIDPDNAEADWSLSLLQMLTGDFEAGWAGREVRWQARSVVYPKLPQSKWLGAETIAGKTVLIGADEGLGDTIQFARYVPMVAARGARVILMVDDAACAVLAELPGVAQCLPKSATLLPAFDMHCPMSSLPLAFATRLDTIPSATSYLPAPAQTRVQTWQDRLEDRLKTRPGPHHRLRVGLVWSGNPEHKNDHNRSLPLRTFSRILDLDATFVSLQKGPKPDDEKFLRERTEIVDLTADLTDFSETAALISCLDLVITVDTSVAHLAGALGCPTWILLPYVPDYRWLLDRDDSPWYPTMQLFRQTETRDYASVLDRVRAELRTRISAFRLGKN